MKDGKRISKCEMELQIETIGACHEDGGSSVVGRGWLDGAQMSGTSHPRVSSPQSKQMGFWMSSSFGEHSSVRRTGRRE